MRFIGYTLLILLVSACILGLTAYLMRNSIVKIFVNEANKSIQAQIFVDKISLDFIHTFPEFAIEFKNIRIVETVPGSTKDFARAERLYFSFSIWDLLNKKYKIKNLYLKGAKINFKILESGANNFTILKKGEESTQKVKIVFDLKGVRLDDVDIMFDDKQLKNTFGAYIKNAKADFKLIDEDWDISVMGELTTHVVKLRDWAFFKEKPAFLESKIIYSAKDKTYKVTNSSLKVLNADFAIEGIYRDGKKPFVDFKFSEQNSDFQTIISFLPPKFSEPLQYYKSKGDVYFSGIVKGEISRQKKTRIKIDFGCKNASFYHPEYKEGVENVSFKGLFDNERESDLKAVFSLDNIKASLNEKTFEGNFNLINFYDPFITLDAKSTVDADYFFKIFPNENIEKIEGEAAFDVKFKGRIADAKTKNYAALHTEGNISLKNINLKSKKLRYEVKNLSGDFEFTKTDLSAKNFACQLGSSDIKADGKFVNIIPYILYPGLHDIQIEATTTSNSLNLDELLSAQTDSSTEKYKFSLPSHLKLNLSSKIDKLKFNRFKPTAIEGKLTLSNQKLEGQGLKMDIAGGKLTLDGSIMMLKDSTFGTETKFKLDKMKIDSIFYMLDNFGQNFITHRNLKGTISSDVSALFIFNKYLEINTTSLVAEAQTVIKDGQLQNFKPMKNLAKFVDEEALENIRFSELKNTIQIAKKSVFIPEMEIASNITKMSVMGTHGFDNEFEYRLKIPLRNYKKKNNLEEQQAIEGNIFTGFYLYLIIKGNPDNFKVIYDKAAVKQKIKERWKEEKEEIKEIFKKDYQKKQIEKQKAAEASEDEYFDF